MAVKYEVKGMLLTVGCAYLADQRSEEDAPAVKMLKDAGAIVLIKGNIPQVSVHSE